MWDGRIKGNNQDQEGKCEYVFDRKIKSWKGNLYDIQIVNEKTTETSFLSMDQIYEMLGHPSDEIIKATARKLNIKAAD